MCVCVCVYIVSMTGSGCGKGREWVSGSKLVTWSRCITSHREQHTWNSLSLSINALLFITTWLTFTGSHWRLTSQLSTGLWAQLCTSPGLSRLINSPPFCWWWQLELEDVPCSSQILTHNKPTPTVYRLVSFTFTANSIGALKKSETWYKCVLMLIEKKLKALSWQ